jgi:hypothetical protein
MAGEDLDGSQFKLVTQWREEGRRGQRVELK